MNSLRESLNRTFPVFLDGDRGLMARQRKLAVVPKKGNVIASSYTSPLDLIYLAAKYPQCSSDVVMVGTMLCL